MLTSFDQVVAVVPIAVPFVARPAPMEKELAAILQVSKTDH